MSQEKLITEINELGEYTLFPEYQTTDNHGNSVDTRMFCLSKDVVTGIMDEYSDWVEDDPDGYAVKMCWWDGSNPQSTWAHVDEVEHATLEEVKRIRYYSDDSPHERYESYYTDNNGSYYVHHTSNDGNENPALVEISQPEWDWVMIYHASNLDRLVEACNSAGPEFQDFSSLPTWGKPIEDTLEIWSWDDNRMMLQDCNGVFYLEDR